MFKALVIMLFISFVFLALGCVLDDITVMSKTLILLFTLILSVIFCDEKK